MFVRVLPSIGQPPLRRAVIALALVVIGLIGPAVPDCLAAPSARQTSVAIRDGKFLINGQVTFPGRTWRGRSVEGLLPNSRMVQGIFDDLNPQTRSLWAYADTGRWDAERNTTEFIAAMPSWREQGLLAFTLNLQGGSPTGYGNKGWINTAFAANGALHQDYFGRLERILNRADELGMVVILGLFYAGQSNTLQDEAAVLRATDLTLTWLFNRDYRNVIIEVCNETGPGFPHKILQPEGVARLLQRIRQTARDGRTFPVGVSMLGQTLPTEAIVAASDVILLHGNNRRGDETTPARIREMIKKTKALRSYQGAPIVFNEDDHYAFDQADNNFFAATEAGASWGFFDYRRPNEALSEGFQSVPADWTVSSARKRAFFTALRQIFIDQEAAKPGGNGR